VAQPHTVGHLTTREGVEQMASQRRIEGRRVILRILGEIARTVPADTPARAATGAAIASLLLRLISRDTARTAS
jgi:hypothetical protein